MSYAYLLKYIIIGDTGASLASPSSRSSMQTRREGTFVDTHAID